MKKYSLSINGNSYTVQLLRKSAQTVTAEVNGVEHTVTVEDIENVLLFPERAKQQTRPPVVTATKKIDTRPKKGSGDFCPFGSGNLLAPIPGQIIAIDVKPGDNVKKGDSLLVLEAMKMENVLTATHDGTIRELLVETGEAVGQDQTLIVFDS